MHAAVTRDFEAAPLDGPVRAPLVAGLLLATLLAGCGGPATGTATGTGADDRMRIAGLVEGDTLLPLGNATVAIAELNLTVRTDDLGTFHFPPLPPHVYSVAASHAGYGTVALVARPETNAGSLDFVLPRVAVHTPRQDAFHFRGALECGFEALIIAGSCDANQGVLGNQTEFDFGLTANWTTTVVDVVFDANANPGLDGLRLVVRGQGDADRLGTYRQFGRFHNATSYTVRLEPGHTYPDGTAPLDANLTRMVLDVYPQGRLYHEACVPPTPVHAGECALGAGAGTNIAFDLYVTVFYVTPAPPGYTLRTDT